MYQFKYWHCDFDIEVLNIEHHKPDLVDSFGVSISDEYYQGYESALQYAYNVLSGKRIASQTEIAMCERFCYDLCRNDLKLDHNEINLCISIINLMNHPKGPIAGTPLKLMRWMIFQLANMFGWFYTDNALPMLRGARRTQRSIIFVPRGNAKTTLAAAVVILNTLLTSNGAPVATLSATTSGQARIAYKDIAQMIKTSPALTKYFKVMQYQIQCKPNDGYIMTTSKNADAFNGLRIVTGVVDEWAAHPNGDITDAITTGMGSSNDPMLLCISTAYNNLGYGFESFNYAKDVVTNKIEHDRTFVAIYAADQDDVDNYGDEQVWIKANPAYGHSVQAGTIDSAYKESLRNEAAKANFLIKHLNVFYTFDAEGFVNQSDFINCKTELDLTKYTNKECYIGLDLASVDDLSSAVLIFPNNDGGVDLFHRAYLPETVIPDLKPAIRDLYMQAQKNGELILTHTEVTDFNYIKNDIISWCDQFDVKAVSIDAAAGGARFAFDMYEEHGIEVVAVKQGFGLSESSILFQNLVKDSKVKYQDNLLEWGILNSLMVQGEYGDIRITKSKIDPTKKIDPCISTLIGLSQTILKTSEQSVYEDQEVRFL